MDFTLLHHLSYTYLQIFSLYPPNLLISAILVKLIINDIVTI